VLSYSFKSAETVESSDEQEEKKEERKVDALPPRIYKRYVLYSLQRNLIS
jgi:hypothetical protein